MVLGWTLLATIAVAMNVGVEGSTLCPAPADVARQLVELLPARGDDVSERVHLAEDSRALVITIFSVDGVLLGERRLDRGPPCSELAVATALVIAARHSDVHPRFGIAAKIATTTAATAVPSGPVPGDATAARSSAAVPATPARPSGAVFEVGLGVLACAAPDGGAANPAAGIMLEAARRAAGGSGGLWLRAALLGTTAREQRFASGAAIWRRTGVGVGGGVRLFPRSRAVALDLHADVVAAWLSVEGTGFDINRRDDGLDVAIEAAGRVVIGAGRRPRSLTPWLEVGGLAWPRSHVVFEQPGGTAARLPKWEAYLALGASYAATHAP